MAPSRRAVFRILIPAVIILDVLAFLFVPPYAGEPGTPVGSIGDLIAANLEFPAPHVLFPEGHESPPGIVFYDVSITNTLFTMWLVMGFILLVALVARFSLREIPGRLQNAVEFAWEALEGWAVALGGEGARKHIPLFVAFFLFILFSNWSGLLPFFGKFEQLRAPTSDVNVTIGLALVVFVYFQFQGFRALGIRRYLGKFFVFSGFKEGPANGFIGLFVGLIEFLLEFIKPVTLAMRLFGNIFGGEVALGVITALTIALIPAAMLLLEGLLNFVQALIFSTLMLIYTIIAVETHETEHDEAAHPPIPEGNIGPPMTSPRPAH
ncbi:MAG TPA: FoF1 ATP synthase subunit a [Candidatus Limnocylindrales bacterium]|nr:FoF1 ATP synthase subunit a [Candidatus Limnocylindrales bacterium]